jgi:hypothetical protein
MNENQRAGLYGRDGFRNQNIDRMRRIYDTAANLDWGMLERDDVLAAEMKRLPDAVRSHRSNSRCAIRGADFHIGKSSFIGGGGGGVSYSVAG